MYDYSRRGAYADVRSDVARGERPAVLGKVLGLLGFAFLFTAVGAVVGRELGPGAFVISIVGSLGTVIALQFLRERAPPDGGRTARRGPPRRRGIWVYDPS